jgi:D-3-phosphoglycerate dehydrogenase
MENEALVLELLEWIGPTGKSYEDVMDAWRTSCPRLTIWEDALVAGLVVVQTREVSLTAVGRDFLRTRRNRVSGYRAKRRVT